MPFARIQIHEGRYDDKRLDALSAAVQASLLEVLKVPADDFFQIIDELPRRRFRHTPSFLGMTYSDDFILLELTFIAGRPTETRLALLKTLNERIVAATGVSPDDLMVMFHETAGENISFGRGLAQRAQVSAGT